MDHSVAPLLEAVADYHARDRYGSPRRGTARAAALRALTEDAADLPPANPVDLLSAGELELEPAMLPRDAFFAAKETITADHGAGRICAEQITPYPPAIPVIIPGERITAELLDYLRTGLAAGM